VAFIITLLGASYICSQHTHLPNAIIVFLVDNVVAAMKRTSGDPGSDRSSKRTASSASPSRSAGSGDGLAGQDGQAGYEGLGGCQSCITPRRTYDAPEREDRICPDQRWVMLRPDQPLTDCGRQMRSYIVDGANTLCSRYGFVVKVRWHSELQALFICFENKQTSSQCCDEVNDMLYADLVMLGAPAEGSQGLVNEHVMIVANEISHRDIPRGAELMKHDRPCYQVD